MLIVAFILVSGALWLHYETTDPNGRWFHYFH